MSKAVLICIVACGLKCLDDRHYNSRAARAVTSAPWLCVASTDKVAVASKRDISMIDTI
jgi:hypothetical protein